MITAQRVTAQRVVHGLEDAVKSHGSAKGELMAAAAVHYVTGLLEQSFRLQPPSPQPATDIASAAGRFASVVQMLHARYVVPMAEVTTRLTALKVFDTAVAPQFVETDGVPQRQYHVPYCDALEKISTIMEGYRARADATVILSRSSPQKAPEPQGIPGRGTLLPQIPQRTSSPTFADQRQQPFHNPFRHSLVERGHGVTRNTQQHIRPRDASEMLRSSRAESPPLAVTSSALGALSQEDIYTSARGFHNKLMHKAFINGHLRSDYGNGGTEGGAQARATGRSPGPRPNGSLRPMASDEDVSSPREVSDCESVEDTGPQGTVVSASSQQKVVKKRARRSKHFNTKNDYAAMAKHREDPFARVNLADIAVLQQRRRCDGDAISSLLRAVGAEVSQYKQRISGHAEPTHRAEDLRPAEKNCGCTQSVIERIDSEDDDH